MNKTITIRCTPELRRKLKQEAKAINLSLSELLRKKLEKVEAGERVQVRRKAKRMIIEIALDKT